VAALRQHIARVFGYAEDLVYIGLAALLAASALVLLGSTAVAFWRGLVGGTFVGGLVNLLDQLLLVLMVVEILYTVHVSFREHVLTAPPFLLVALIASVRRIVVLTAETHTLSQESPAAYQRALVELGVLGAIALSIVICLHLLRVRSPEAAPVAKRT
jgi:uncharacterized membrane protein (DUF373 family)